MTAVVDGNCGAGQIRRLREHRRCRRRHRCRCRHLRRSGTDVRDRVITPAGRDEADARGARTETVTARRFAYWRHRTTHLTVAITSAIPAHLVGMWPEPQSEEPPELAYWDPRDEHPDNPWRLGGDGQLPDDEVEPFDAQEDGQGPPMIRADEVGEEECRPYHQPQPTFRITGTRQVGGIVRTLGRTRRGIAKHRKCRGEVWQGRFAGPTVTTHSVRGNDSRALWTVGQPKRTGHA
jgi:hypothetical protein